MHSCVTCSDAYWLYKIKVKNSFECSHTKKIGCDYYKYFTLHPQNCYPRRIDLREVDETAKIYFLKLKSKVLYRLPHQTLSSLGWWPCFFQRSLLINSFSDRKHRWSNTVAEVSVNASYEIFILVNAAKINDATH